MCRRCLKYKRTTFTFHTRFLSPFFFFFFHRSSISLYFLQPERTEQQVEEVKAGTLASRNSFKTFSPRQSDKLCCCYHRQCCANAYSSQHAFYFLSASEARPPLYSRLICCLLLSLAELEISCVELVPTQSF